MEFTVHKGPIFASLVLADEINRAPAKVQSALLEAMQERQVTIGDTTHMLDELFLVLATQNPIEQEGTYPLPEAQVDRFMLKVQVDYPSRAEERQIVDRMTGEPLAAVRPVINTSDILNARKIVRSIYVDDKVKEYVMDLIVATREPSANGIADLGPLIAYGASPRARHLSYYRRSGARLLERSGLRDPGGHQGARSRHSPGTGLIPTYEAEAQSVTAADIVQQILDHVQVP